MFGGCHLLATALLCKSLQNISFFPGLPQECCCTSPHTGDRATFSLFSQTLWPWDICHGLVVSCPCSVCLYSIHPPGGAWKSRGSLPVVPCLSPESLLDSRWPPKSESLGRETLNPHFWQVSVMLCLCYFCKKGKLKTR